MRSIASNGRLEMSTNERCPSSPSGYGAIRRPSIRTSVAPTLRPRSEMPEAPSAKPPPNPWASVPCPLAVRLLSTSCVLVKPDALSSAAEMTWTGPAVSTSVRRMFEPVTVTRSS